MLMYNCKVKSLQSNGSASRRVQQNTHTQHHAHTDRRTVICESKLRAEDPRPLVHVGLGVSGEVVGSLPPPAVHRVQRKEMAVVRRVETGEHLVTQSQVDGALLARAPLRVVVVELRRALARARQGGGGGRRVQDKVAATPLLHTRNTSILTEHCCIHTTPSCTHTAAYTQHQASSHTAAYTIVRECAFYKSYVFKQIHKFL